MSGKITGFLREYVLGLSIIFTILGGILLFLGITMIWFQDIPKKMLGFSEDIILWNIYVLIFGFIVFATGVYYLYSYLKNRKFVVKELETNKRSEFLKKHVEVKQKVKHLPSKYKKMLTEKEEQLQIK
jgi:heme/copper-type cytochrome/quinol oxidase subunit 1